MAQGGRVLVTLVIWIGVFGVIAGTFTSVTGPIATMESGQLLGFAAILVMGAAISTGAMWSQRGDSASEEGSSKSKRVRPSRVQRLISELDDDEVYELESLLLAREDQQQQSSTRQK